LNAAQDNSSKNCVSEGNSGSSFKRIIGKEKGINWEIRKKVIISLKLIKINPINYLWQPTTLLSRIQKLLG
jgi:hypothetical protein